MGTFKRNSKGIAAILKGPDMARAIQAKGAEVAGHIHAVNPDVDPGVHPYTTDRAGVTVAVADGAPLQATEGIFTRAASAAGLEVESR